MARHHGRSQPRAGRVLFGRIRRGGYPVFLMITLLGGCLLVFAGGFVVREFWRSQVPEIEILRTHYPVIVPMGRQTLDSSARQLFKVRWTSKRPESWVSLSNVSTEAIGAILVSEDWAFFSHRGYDLNQIREALKHDLKRGSFARGASTIHQQLVKNIFLSSEKTLWRKVKEFYLASRLDRLVGKKKVLETYLNVVEWGPETYGISSASARYFGKSPLSLTAREGAFLAMLLPSPLRYSQSYRQRRLTPYARRTIHQIFEKMIRAGYLTPEAAEASRRERMVFESTVSPLPGDSTVEDHEEDLSGSDPEVDQDGP